MEKYVIFADSACDIPEDMLHEWGVECIQLSFVFDGEDRQYAGRDMSASEFYRRMRAGSTAKTSAANTEVFKEAFEPVLQSGRDILYIGFSSGLSSTCTSGALAAGELLEAYPERRILTADSLAASAGYGLLVYLTAQRRLAGADIDEAFKYACDTRLHVCHWFTVDDLVYLKRGGRVSAATALVGGMLGIKPVLHVDNEGHLINVTKVRGRKPSIQAIADKYGELALEKGSGTVFISHGDCAQDAEKLKDMLKERYGIDVRLTVDIGPIIGAHSGPGTLAVFFLGRER